MFCVIIELIRTTNANSAQNLSIFQRIKQKITVVRTSILFVVLYLLLWITVQNFQFELIKNYDALSVSALQWVTCTFTHFDPKDPEAWKNTCGFLPKNVVNFDYVTWVILTVSGQSILIAGVYMSAILTALTRYMQVEKPQSSLSSNLKPASSSKKCILSKSALSSSQLSFLYPSLRKSKVFSSTSTIAATGKVSAPNTVSLR